MNYELWLPVSGYEWLYIVSNLGKIQNIKTGRELSTIDNHGYKLAGLCRKGKQIKIPIHRIVMTAFVGPVPENYIVNHKNGVKHDNRLSNLEYVTHSENMTHAKKLGLFDPRGTGNANAKINEGIVHQIRHLSHNHSYQEIADTLGTTWDIVQSVVSGRGWKHVVTPNSPAPRKHHGSNTTLSKLTESDVVEIKHLIGSITYVKIGKLYNVSEGAIADIASGRTWRHIRI